MAWSQCKVEIGKTGTNDALASAFTSVGYVEENSASLETDLGTPLEAWASGHKLIAQEYPQETLTFTCVVIEPDSELLSMLGIADGEGEGDTIKTHVVQDFFSLKVTPKHVGAKGIEAPKCKITYAPTYGEDAGNKATLTFAITKTTDATTNYWYKRFVNDTELS